MDRLDIALYEQAKQELPHPSRQVRRAATRRIQRKIHSAKAAEENKNTPVGTPLSTYRSTFRFQ